MPERVWTGLFQSYGVMGEFSSNFWKTICINISYSKCE